MWLLVPSEVTVAGPGVDDPTRRPGRATPPEGRGKAHASDQRRPLSGLRVPGAPTGHMGNAQRWHGPPPRPGPCGLATRGPPSVQPHAVRPFRHPGAQRECTWGLVRCLREGPHVSGPRLLVAPVARPRGPASRPRPPLPPCGRSFTGSYREDEPTWSQVIVCANASHTPSQADLWHSVDAPPFAFCGPRLLGYYQEVCDSSGVGGWDTLGSGCDTDYVELPSDVLSIMDPTKAYRVCAVPTVSAPHGVTRSGRGATTPVAVVLALADGSSCPLPAVE